MRVLLFGIDGLTFRILNPLIGRGLLPNFRRLREGGVDGPIYPSFGRVAGRLKYHQAVVGELGKQLL